MLKPLNESAKHSLNLGAKAIGITYSSRLSTSELRIALGERLELQIEHLQRTGMGLNQGNAECMRELKQGMRVVEDATKAIFH
jgi:hypothetical protein